MQMQLRKNRKKKIMGDEDLGYEEKPQKSHKKAKSKLKRWTTTRPRKLRLCATCPTASRPTR